MQSATADHAIRALLVLARSERGQLVRADEIATATGAPANYMAKTLNALARSGLVSSGRGRTGGFALAVAPGALTLADVVDLFDTPRPQARCMLGNAPCDRQHPCIAHERWTAVVKAQRTALTSTTLADLLGDTAGGVATRTWRNPVSVRTAHSSLMHPTHTEDARI